MNLALTEQGETTLQSARKGTQEYLKEQFSRISEAERGTVVKGMVILRRVFLEEVP